MSIEKKLYDKLEVIFKALSLDSQVYSLKFEYCLNHTDAGKIQIQILLGYIQYIITVGLARDEKSNKREGDKEYFSILHRILYKPVFDRQLETRLFLINSKFLNLLNEFINDKSDYIKIRPDLKYIEEKEKSDIYERAKVFNGFYVSKFDAPYRAFFSYDNNACSDENYDKTIIEFQKLETINDDTSMSKVLSRLEQILRVYKEKDLKLVVFEIVKALDSQNKEIKDIESLIQTWSDNLTARRWCHNIPKDKEIDEYSDYETKKEEEDEEYEDEEDDEEEENEEEDDKEEDKNLNGKRKSCDNVENAKHLKVDSLENCATLDENRNEANCVKLDESKNEAD